MNVLLNIFFYFYLYVIGDFFKKKVIKQEKIFGVKTSVFNPLFVLIICGNIIFLSNFFFQGSTFVYFVMISSIVIFVLSMRTFNFTYAKIIPFISFSFLLSFSTYGVSDHYDFGFYHLLNQNWIFSEKIAFGLSNIMFPLGNQSIYEYISSIFLIFDNFVTLNFLNLVTVTIFFHFLYECFKNGTSNFLKVASISIIFFGFLDNFGYLGGANGFPNFQHIGKPDIAVAVLVVIFNILIINYLLENSFNNEIFKLITLLAFFLIQLKPTSSYILLIFSYALIKDKFNFLKNKSNYKFNVTIFIISLFWLTKNIIISGCLLFPLKFTCFFNLRWASQKIVDEANKHYSSTYIPYSIDENFLVWLSSWRAVNVNNQIMINFLGSFLLIFVLLKIITKKSSILKKETFAINLYLIVSLLIFFLSVPLFRYSFGILTSLLLILILNRSFKDKYLQNKSVSIIISILFVLTPLFMSRAYSFEVALNNPFPLTKISIPIIEYEEASNWGFIPVESDNNPNKKCWANTKCNPENKNLFVEQKNNYFYILHSQ